MVYSYKPPVGERQSGESQVYEELYEKIESGDEVEVLYLSTDHMQSRLVKTREVTGWFLPIITGVVGTLFVLIGLVLIVTCFRKAARQSA